MKTIRRFLLVTLCCGGSLLLSAQQVNTLYFLENTPMRHLINPAFQPVSDGYIALPVIGYSGLWVGNNSLTMSDLIYKDPTTGNTITALHPNGDQQKLYKSIRNSWLLSGDMQMNILGLGVRVKEKGYLNINIMQRVDAGLSLPKPLFGFVLDGGMKDVTGVNNFNLTALKAGVSIYTEFGVGYSHQINEHWTVGGKLKFLLGEAYVGFNPSNLQIDAQATQWNIYGEADLMIAGPQTLNWDQTLPEYFNYETVKEINTDNLMDNLEYTDFLLKPAGFGGAIDLGFTYKPIKQLQITAAINDLGFIYWGSGARKYELAIDTVFEGVGDLVYSDYVEEDGRFNADKLGEDALNNTEKILDGLHSSKIQKGFTRMINGKLNVGIDANFCNNILGLGVLSETRLYNGRVYEEVTFGGAVRPCNWFNLAISYSLLQNGKYSNIGAGLSIMPYDGINLTVAMDYIPTSYASLNVDDKPRDILPYKAKGVNIAAGLTIVWGTNHKKDKDKDGVLDKWDMCPNTPSNVRVDEMGCPLDTDGDGIPDYLDECPNTPTKAYGLIDDKGCPIDTDGDGVPDYMDKCSDTPAEAIGYLDEFGCELDTDGDGVPDWRDDCPNTPAEAIGYVDERGCELDSDGDGVPDWKDLCPNTPVEARGYLNEFGCELDSDGDGVPDWRDQCPNTPKEAIGFTDEKGCELDTDGDGVPDWCDECPTVPGVKINKGCPEVKREIRSLLQKAMQGIQFETGKATIKKQSNVILDQIAQVFIENPTYIVEVQGHTDNVGNATLNKDLSDRRAKAVREYLIKKGVEPERLTANGYGMERPIADNKTAKGRQLNRRVEFNITFEEVTTETIYDHADPQDLEQMQQQQDSAAVAAPQTVETNNVQ